MSNIELLKKLIIDNKLTHREVTIYSPGGWNHTITDVIQTENYLIVYNHSRGNHWNMGGNHYKMYHDIKTGKQTLLQPNEKEISKDRMLMKDYRTIMEILDQQSKL